VTPKEIEARQTAKGGYTKAQLAEWGVPWPPPKGWKAGLLKVNMRERTDAAAALHLAIDDVFTGPEESQMMLIWKLLKHLDRQGFEVRRKKGVLTGSPEPEATCAGGGNAAP
jgi:hypothetical protein